MINQDQIMQDFTREFSSLPPLAQRQLLDFMAFLRDRYGERETASAKTASDLQREPFVGMWRNYEEMTDSSQWVRKLREREWNG
jgi:L-arabinose isomerase